MNDLQSLAKIAVIDDEMAAGLVSKNARADLAARVSAVPAEDVHSGRTRQRRWLIARLRLIATVPVAVALSAAVLVIGLLARPGGPGGIVSANAALVITKHSRSVDVIVRNPRAVSADVQRFREELSHDGVDVTIVLFPVSPPMVGKYLGYGGDGELGQMPGLSAIGKNGVRVSASFQGTAEIFIGRAAQPGEQYFLSESATAPGEVLAGVDLAGKTVADVLPLLGSASVAPVYIVEAATSDGRVVDTPADSVPGSYFVYNAVTYGPGKVQLEVGATPTPPDPQPEPSGSSSPAPSDTPTPSPS